MIFPVYTRPSEVVNLNKGTVYIYRHTSRIKPPLEVSISGEIEVSGAFYKEEKAQEYADFLVDKPK